MFFRVRSMAQQSATTALKSIKLSACTRILSKGIDSIGFRMVKPKTGMDAVDHWIDIFADILPKCPLPPSFSFHIKYQDTGADTTTIKEYDRIVVTSHGSPGSHDDFKYITRALIDGNDPIRVLGINWPEHGHSEVLNEGETLYFHSSTERAELMHAFLQELKVKKADVLVGHSFGCYPLTALGADEDYCNRCKALLLVNCGGPTPHKSIRPYAIVQLLADACYHPIFGKWFRRMTYVVARYVWGVKVQSSGSAGVNITVMANLDYQLLPQRLDRLRRDPKTPRVLAVYSEDDPLMEKESSENLARALGASIIQGWRDDSLDKIRDWWKTYDPKASDHNNKNLVVNFGKGRGGHFLQKHQADFIAQCIKIMSEN